MTAAGGGGLDGVGLTLTGKDATYKTMSQSNPAGGFGFTGVIPGNYVLTGVLFGRVPTSVNVKVAAAGTTTVNLSLANDNLAAVVRNSDISVRVVDDRSGDALKCDRLPLGTPPSCDVTISGLVPTYAGRSDPKPTPVEVTELNTVVGYTWPKKKNLPAGLYQLTITAPGFEPARVSVQVQEGATASAPEVRLQPLGLVSGTVTARVGTPTGQSCAVAYQFVTQAATAPTTCDIAKCNATVTSASVLSACAVVDRGKGTYSIPGLSHGGYQVRIIPTDQEYLATEPVSVLLGFGDAATVDAVLDRLGRLTVTTLAPDLITAALRPAADARIEVAPVADAPPSLRPSGTSAENGTFTATGLRGVYRVSASGDQGADSVISPAVGLNQTLAETLVLTEPIGPVVGQVSTTVDGNPVLIRDATVTITGITGYTGATPVSGAARVTTDANGCFAVVQAGWTGASTALKSDDCKSGVAASAVAVAQANDVDTSLVTRTVAVAVARAGTRTEAFQATDVLVSDLTDANVRTLPAILVSAQPSAFGMHKLSASPSSAVVDTTTLVFTATRRPAGAGSVTMTMDTGSGGQLQLRDSTQSDAGRVVPGHYAFVANSRGFATANFTLDCDLGNPCVLTQQDNEDPDPSSKDTIDDNLVMFQLPKIQGELSLSALPPNQDDAYIEDATVSVVTAPPAAGTTSVAVTRTDCVTGPSELCRALLFRDSSQIVDGLAVPGDYLFSVSLAGFPQRQIPVTCGADYRIGCTPLSLLLDRFPKFGGVLELSSSDLPGDTVADISKVTVTVLAQPNAGTPVAVSVQPPDGAGRSVLTWVDDSLPDGLITPGRYSLQFSLPGFRTTTVTFTCPADAQQCIIYKEGSTETSIGEGRDAGRHPTGRDGDARYLRAGDAADRRRTGDRGLRPARFHLGTVCVRHRHRQRPRRHRRPAGHPERLRRADLDRLRHSNRRAHPGRPLRPHHQDPRVRRRHRGGGLHVCVDLHSDVLRPGEAGTPVHRRCGAGGRRHGTVGHRHVHRLRCRWFRRTDLRQRRAPHLEAGSGLAGQSHQTRHVPDLRESRGFRGRPADLHLHGDHPCGRDPARVHRRPDRHVLQVRAIPDLDPGLGRQWCHRSGPHPVRQPDHRRQHDADHQSADLRPDADGTQRHLPDPGGRTRFPAQDVHVDLRRGAVRASGRDDTEPRPGAEVG